jgi:hypothetical protein
MYFIYLYKNRTEKLVEIKLSRGEGNEEMMEVMHLTKVHYKHVWKCDNETPSVQLIYAK